MQQGTIIKHHASWRLLYYDTVLKKGVRQRVRISKKLAPVSPEYPTEKSVRQLAEDILGPVNRKQVQPESSLKITEYIEDYYFPGIENELRPSTVLNYRVSIYEKHLKPRLGKLTMRDARPEHFQRLLRDIPSVGHITLLHIKNFLSGVFRFASREGALYGLNPVSDCTVPGRAKKFRGAAYTIDEIERMLEDLHEGNAGRAKVLSLDELEKEPTTIIVKHDHTVCEVIGLLSLTGLRQSEARGLRWSDWDEQNETLMISRSVWQTRVGPTKNEESEGFIPVLPLLRDLLTARRERIKPRQDDYVFAGTRRGTPLDFHNLSNRVIKPALANGQNGVVFKGYHGFRRGLATNLFDLQVHPKLIAALLRHSDVNTTMRFYIRERDTETRAALAKFESVIRTRPNMMKKQVKQEEVKGNESEMVSASNVEK